MPTMYEDQAITTLITLGDGDVVRRCQLFGDGAINVSCTSGTFTIEDTQVYSHRDAPSNFDEATISISGAPNGGTLRDIHFIHCSRGLVLAGGDAEVVGVSSNGLYFNGVASKDGNKSEVIVIERGSTTDEVRDCAFNHVIANDCWGPLLQINAPGGEALTGNTFTDVRADVADLLMRGSGVTGNKFLEVRAHRGYVWLRDGCTVNEVEAVFQEGPMPYDGARNQTFDAMISRRGEFDIPGAVRDDGVNNLVEVRLGTAIR